MTKQDMIQAYFDAWIKKDRSFMESCFHEDIRYSECYGTVYHGTDQILAWFDEWKEIGSVLEWEIKSYMESGDTSYVEWYFLCDYADQVDGFDGVSQIRFKEDKFVEVKEFSSVAYHSYPQNKDVVVAYDENWPKVFDILKGILMKKVEPFVSAIEHVGSTSIPGMLAKPIIDMDMVLKHPEMFEAIKEALTDLGYEHVGDQGIKDREVFKLANEVDRVLSHVVHHLYVCPPESEELKQHIRFRDCLRADECLREEYNQVKREILNLVGWDNRTEYVTMKEEKYGNFFAKIIY